MATLSAYTHDNAWLEFNEDRKGSLKPGYLADIAILEQDLFSIEESQLAH